MRACRLKDWELNYWLAGETLTSVVVPDSVTILDVGALSYDNNLSESNFIFKFDQYRVECYFQ